MAKQNRFERAAALFLTGCSEGEFDFAKPESAHGALIAIWSSTPLTPRMW